MRAVVDGGDVIEPLSERVLGRSALEDVVDPLNGSVLLKGGELIDEVKVEQLEKEHRSFDEAIAALDPEGPEFERLVSDLLRELDEHVERENLGIFPVSIVTLGAAGWELVEEARRSHPTFLSQPE